MFKIGSRVVYRKPKYGILPGPRAKRISPARHGDAYSYFVEKLWLVVRQESPDKLIVKTRRGKQLEISARDPNLRTATLLDLVRYRGRFPKP